MKSKLIIAACLLGQLLLVLPSGAQTLDEVKKLYPSDLAVMLNNTMSYSITLKNGQPFVQSEQTQQIQYLTPQAAAYLTKYGFFHSDFQQLIAYEAYTQTAKDKKMKVTDFKTTTNKQEFVFYDDVKQTTFDFPSITEGAIGNLHVSWLNKNPHLLSPFYFEDAIPVLYSELKLAVSDDVHIKWRLTGIDSANVNVITDKRRHETIYRFIFKNGPARKSYEDAPGSAWYATHVVFFIDSYKNESGQDVNYLSNTDDLYKLNYSFIKDINKQISAELKLIVDSLIRNTPNAQAKAMNIYRWVQQHIKYVAFEQGMEGFVPREANLVCNRRFGDCKDMSSILTVMLKSAGIDAYYTWIGTRSLPYKFTELPLPLVSNHMICTIKLDDHYIFLDGTDPTCIFGFPSSAIQDKQAMISINDHEYKILTVPTISKEQNKIIDSTWLTLTDNGLHGKIKKMFTGYYAMHMLGKLMYTQESDIKQEINDELSRGSNKFRLDSFSTYAATGGDTAVLTGSFSLPDYAKKLDKDWFLNLNLFKFYQHAEIDYPKRRMPIEYNFTGTKKYTTLLNIPTGYKVDYLPAGKSYHNDVWGFDIAYKDNGKQVELTQSFETPSLQIVPSQFQQWNKVLENLFPLYKETLSLSKNN